MDIKCAYQELVDITAIKPDPENRNKHSEEQINRLADLINHYGVRHPIIVSRQTKYVVAGHGRFLALKKLGAKQVPVDWQDFESRDLEKQFAISDNGIAAWAELDFAGINVDIQDWGPELDIDLLGIKDFEIDIVDKFQDVENKPKKHKICPNCNYKF